MLPTEAPITDATKEDHIIRLLDELIARDIALEGRIPQIFAFEADLLSLAATTVPADFPHDAWVVTFRPVATGVIRVWPGGSPPASGAIEIQTGGAVRFKSTSNQLYIFNSGPVTVHYFAYALSLAELEFMSVA